MPLDDRTLLPRCPGCDLRITQLIKFYLMALKKNAIFQNFVFTFSRVLSPLLGKSTLEGMLRRFHMLTRQVRVPLIGRPKPSVTFSSLRPPERRLRMTASNPPKPDDGLAVIRRNEAPAGREDALAFAHGRAKPLYGPYERV